MLISIHDGPRYERHLLFCSRLSGRAGRRPVKHRSEVPALNRSLAVVGECVSKLDLVPLAKPALGAA